MCGSGVRVDTTPTPHESVLSAYGTVQQLDETLAGTAAGDCEQACGLQVEICRLSEWICEIAYANPGDGELAEMCEDSDQRCGRASIEVEATCECSQYEEGTREDESSDSFVALCIL